VRILLFRFVEMARNCWWVDSASSFGLQSLIEKEWFVTVDAQMEASL
jgi:hypothetical protein